MRIKIICFLLILICNDLTGQVKASAGFNSIYVNDEGYIFDYEFAEEFSSSGINCDILLNTYALQNVKIENSYVDVSVNSGKLFSGEIGVLKDCKNSGIVRKFGVCFDVVNSGDVLGNLVLLKIKPDVLFYGAVANVEFDKCYNCNIAFFTGNIGIKNYFDVTICNSLSNLFAVEVGKLFRTGTNALLLKIGVAVGNGSLKGNVPLSESIFYSNCLQFEGNVGSILGIADVRYEKQFRLGNFWCRLNIIYIPYFHTDINSISTETLLGKTDINHSEFRIKMDNSLLCLPELGINFKLVLKKSRCHINLLKRLVIPIGTDASTFAVDAKNFVSTALKSGNSISVSIEFD